MQIKNIIIYLTIFILLGSFLVILNPMESITNKQTTPLPDADNDGIADEYDAFPNDPTEFRDYDGDGVGDNEDEFEYNPYETKDTDGDNVGDNSDEFPFDPSEWSDKDKDGYGDQKDINSNVNLSISFKLERFKVINKVDLIRWAQIYFKVKVNDEEYVYNNNDKYYFVFLNKVKEVNKEIFLEIPDDTDQESTIIEIFMYDYDLIGQDDIVDINEDSSKDSLTIIYDYKTNTITKNEKSKGQHAEIWFDIVIANQVEYDSHNYKKEYTWEFRNTNFMLDFDIPIDTYKNYQDLDVNRVPQGEDLYVDAMSSFVTEDEKVISDLSEDLKAQAQSKSYTKIDTANFILRFVQENIYYALDDDTKNAEEYWRFAVETLVDQEGDCEDTSVLYASIMKSLGYEVSLLFYTWDGEDGKLLGHLAVGVNLDKNTGDYVETEEGKKYYYCETTTTGYSVGKLPPDINNDYLIDIIEL